MKRIVKFVISVITFLTYVNITRFDWAYRDLGDKRTVDDIIIVVFLIAACMTFINSPDANTGEEGEVLMNPTSKLIMIGIAFALISLYQFIVNTPQVASFRIENASLALVPGILVILGIFGGGFAFLLSDSAKDTSNVKKNTTYDWVIGSGLTLSGIVMMFAVVMYVIESTS